MKKTINTITKNYIEECSSAQNKDVDKGKSASNIINREKREAEMQNFDEIKEQQNNINYINKYLTKIFNFEKDCQPSLSKEDTTKGSSGSDDFSETLSRMFTKNNSNIEWELDNTYEFETMDDNNYMKLESSLSKTNPETFNFKNKENINNISNFKFKKAHTNGVDGNDNLFSSKLNLNNFNSFNECDNLDKCFPPNADVFKFKKDNIPNNEINVKCESLKEPLYQHIKNNNCAKKVDDNLLTRILHALNEKNDEQNNINLNKQIIDNINSVKNCDSKKNNDSKTIGEAYKQFPNHPDGNNAELFHTYFDSSLLNSNGELKETPKNGDNQNKVSNKNNLVYNYFKSEGTMVSDTNNSKEYTVPEYNNICNNYAKFTNDNANFSYNSQNNLLNEGQKREDTIFGNWGNNTNDNNSGDNNSCSPFTHPFDNISNNEMKQNNDLEVKNFTKKNDNYDYSNFNANNFSMNDINSYEKYMANGNNLNNKNYNSQDIVVETLNHLVENYLGHENKNLDQMFNGKDKKNDIINNNNSQSPQMRINMYEDKRLLSELNEILSSNNSNSQTINNNIHKYQILLEYINNKIEKEAAHNINNNNLNNMSGNVDNVFERNGHNNIDHTIQFKNMNNYVHQYNNERKDDIEESKSVYNCKENINNTFTKINEFDRESMERQNHGNSNENYSSRPNLTYNPQNCINRIDNEAFVDGNNNIPMIDILKSKIKFLLENENNDDLLNKYIIDTIDEYNKSKYNKGMNIINTEICSNNKKIGEKSFKENGNINNHSERGNIINYNNDKEYPFVVNINNDNIYNTNRMMDKQNGSYNGGVGNNSEGIKFNNSHNENTLNLCNETNDIHGDNFKLFLKNRLEIAHGNNYNMDSNNKGVNNWTFNYDEFNRIANIKRNESLVEPNLLSVRNENNMRNSNITGSYMDNNSMINSNGDGNYNYNNVMIDSSFCNMKSENVGEQNNENIKGLMNESLETYKSIFQHPIHLLNKNNIVLDLDNYEKNSRADVFQNSSVISNSNNVENGGIINDVDTFEHVKRESEYKKIQTDYYAANNLSKNKQNEPKENLFNDEYSFYLKSKSAGANNKANYDKYNYDTRGESYFQNNDSYWEDINFNIRREKCEDDEQWSTVKKENSKFLDKEGKKKLSFFLKKNNCSNSGNETNPVWNRNRNSIKVSRTSPKLSFHNKFDELRKGHTENFVNVISGNKGNTINQKLKGRSFLNNAKISKKKKSTEINDKLTMEELKSILTEKDEANLESLLQSLYDDRILPLLINAKGRADEFHFTDILKNNIKEAYSLFPDKYVIKKSTEVGEDYVIYFLKKKVKDDYFFSTNNLKDTYKPQLWKSFEKYLNEIAQSDDSTLYTFSGGRYGMAKELQRRKLPFFDGLYLGELCHIVHLSTNKKMIAYENNYLKPISQCHKYTNAKLGIANTDDKNMENYIMTISELKLYMNKLLKYYKGGFNISTLKKKLKNRFNKQLCESVFHCIKLIEVLQLKELKDTCVVDSELKIVRSVHDVFP
ncbi:hypothetical protein YYC_03049 [Plasmodium yoelii 17X]|uniref:HTH OST-type domain-containing protein n=1 Tax=Plasmodium yoelii 17X TaxID=1323249 RepID=V7PLF8_PLAYE|nr:hypothetical protein YYC_03049 [Plasmodium yoelii 17X]